jgi:Fe-S-cluster-containing hydrogenase component 2
MEDVYRKLAAHMDNLPAGFPATPGGVELRILQRLFTPEEAALALHLTLIAEDARVVAHRAQISERKAAERLEGMEKKGLVYSVQHKDSRRYLATQYALGIWEFQVDKLTYGLVRDMNEYLPVYAEEAWKVPQMRVVPVGASIHRGLQVMIYERAEALVRSAEIIAVAPCLCRREQKMMGKGCDRPEETCLSMGRVAEYYQRNGLARPIGREEALEILKLAEASALVLQPGNFKEAAFICCCCGCCCGVLRTLKQFPRPAQWVATSFVTTVEPDLCRQCGTCENRCQMEAVRLVDGSPRVDRDRCIGCGLCVSTCPSGALRLVRKSEAQQQAMSKNMWRVAARMLRARGRASCGDIARMVLRSGIDRLRAAG